MRTASCCEAPILTACVVLCVFCSSTSPASAAVVFSGEVSPAKSTDWNDTKHGYIGKTSGKSGSITVNGGSVLTSKSGDLGHASGAAGSVTVTGGGSTWTNTYGVVVGYSGTGTMRIENGGQVNNGDGNIAAGGAGASGTVTVTGIGSRWTNRYDLSLGYWGGRSTLRDDSRITSAFQFAENL